ncbi:NADP-dependent 3-hydroxy acid dehydrogenase [Moraxella caviae]|uniref:NADP-dependent 3-hydroxy acid dehydrogenase n=1 Tax=Moraxella caviae TaxID=34060 RepID=A0A1S9ZV05_9GAMM|nr:SDR family NAD(P)-dependent oxidoreductase [Moraxella caviae]OOR87217.1 NADP-dependent 3-hydroxy acid dehydrogenase [Moraxella caviae]STZ09920.1 NADP-dependent 3-hydroxy acid dehydrogenase YdfG [Moraxella caviae]
MNILVTGVTSGFGKQIAADFIAAGHTVVGTGRRADKLAQLQQELGERFLPLGFDVADKDAMAVAFDSLPADFLPNIDVLVNNAGLALGLEPAHQADLGDWQTMINTNTLGLVNVTHAILPHMVAKNDGLIINISSTAGNYPYFGANVYGATKAFVTQFSLNLRADLLGKNVRVSNVEPGLCGGTEFSNVRFKGDDDKASKVYENVQFVSPKDISDIVLWLANQPKHVNINRLEVMPTAQTFAGLTVYKG